MHLISKIKWTKKKDQIETPNLVMNRFGTNFKTIWFKYYVCLLHSTFDKTKLVW